VGFCWFSLGRYEEARGWVERAVAAMERGDVHGRVDYTSLATSVLAVATCYTSLGRPREARQWQKRASQATARAKAD
jgi:lipopolysaccharide biosynthesis regulator YciM